MVRAYRDGVLARNLAEAGVQQAIREILSDANVHGLDEDGPGRLLHAARRAAPRPSGCLRSSEPGCRSGAGAFSYRISDEEARLNINGGVADRMQRLLTALGVDKIERDAIVDADRGLARRQRHHADQRRGERRLPQAAGPLPRAQRQLPGHRRAAPGQGDHAGDVLRPRATSRPSPTSLTVRGRGTVNINTAPAPVLCGAGPVRRRDRATSCRRARPTPTRRCRGGSADAGSTSGARPSGSRPRGSIGRRAQGAHRRHRAEVVRGTAGALAPTVTVLSWRPMPPRGPAKEESGQVMIDEASERESTWATTGSRWRSPTRRGGVQCFTAGARGSSRGSSQDRAGGPPAPAEAHAPRPGAAARHREDPRAAARGGRPARRDGRLRARASRPVPAGGHALRLDDADRARPRGPVRILVVAAERRTVEGALRLLEEPRLKPAALTVACHDLPALLAPTVEGRARRSGRTGRADRSTWSAWPRGGSSSAGRCRRATATRSPRGRRHALAARLARSATRSGSPATAPTSCSPHPPLEQLAASVTAPPWSPAVEAMLPGLPADDQGRATLALAVALGSQRPPLNLLSVELAPADVLLRSARHRGDGRRHRGARGRRSLLGQGYKQQRYADRSSPTPSARSTPTSRRSSACPPSWPRRSACSKPSESIEKADVRPLPIMRELTERLPQDAWLRTLSMDKQGLEITRPGRAPPISSSRCSRTPPRSPGSSSRRR